MEPGATYPRFELRKCSSLAVHPDGVRQASEEAVFNIGKCVEQLGVLRPLVVSARTGRVLDGDLLLEKLRAQGSDEVPCWVVDVPEEQEDTAHLALNNHAGEWQWEKVSKHLQSLAGKKQELALTGFRSHDIAPLLEADWKPQGADPLDDSDKNQQSLL